MARFAPIGRISMVFFLLLSFSLPGVAQVTALGSGSTSTNISSTPFSFTVPAGDNRILVMAVCYSAAPTGFNFNGMPATLAVNETAPDEYNAQIWYLTLGSGPAIADAITLTGGDALTQVIAGAFAGVDQNNPLGNTASLSGSAGEVPNAFLHLSTLSGNLVVNKLTIESPVNPTPTGNIGNVEDLFFTDGRSSFLIASSFNTSTGYNFGVPSEVFSLVAAEFNAANATPVPTLSEWGLILLSLLLVTIGVLYATTPALVLTTQQQRPIDLNFRQLPFYKHLYFNLLLLVACCFLVSFIIAIYGFNYQLTNADPMGSLLTIPLLTYLMMLLVKR